MVWQVIFCVLAAAGILLFLWCLAGTFLLPVAGDGMVIRYRASGGAPALEQTVRSFLWLRETGLIDMPLQIIDDGLDQEARGVAVRLAQKYPCIQLLPAAEEEKTDSGR